MWKITSCSYETFSGAHGIQRDHLWDYFGAAIHRENYQQYSKHWSKSKCKTETWKSNFFKVTNLKSVKLTDQLQNELGISQPNVVAIQVTGLQSLEKFKNMVDKSGCKCVKAAGSLLEANKWVPRHLCRVKTKNHLDIPNSFQERLNPHALRLMEPPVRL